MIIGKAVVDSRYLNDYIYINYVRWIISGHSRKHIELGGQR